MYVSRFLGEGAGFLICDKTAGCGDLILASSYGDVAILTVLILYDFSTGVWNSKKIRIFAPE